ncbi:TauD/TfdA family dioxygenase [Pseudomonas aeruginosa]|uniref:TauD/TfdA family dioxygenase n=1 Tax=Pseudomonas aeruginosa TaxID=287 RepID=UPI003F51C220
MGDHPDPQRVWFPAVAQRTGRRQAGTSRAQGVVRPRRPPPARRRRRHRADQQFSGYLGSTPLEHKLHTDGAFLDTPEQLCSLQCVRNAREGGETLLASAGLAFERLRRRMPTKHLGLLRGDALTIVRKHQSSTQPVFRLNGEALGIKFRQNDGAAEVVEHPVAVEAFAELVAALEDPACQLRIKLEPGEILVLDNTAVLHGRTAFCANELREMRRLNFDGHGRLRAELELGFKVGL